MQDLQRQAQAFIEEEISSFEKLPQAGSDRQYYRFNASGKSFIATYSEDLNENKMFLGLAHYFFKKNLAVPEILGQNAEMNFYVQSDLGHQCLLDIVLENGHSSEVKELYKKSLKSLLQFQLCAKDEEFQDLFKSLPIFDYRQMLFDLNYFKTYFLDPTDYSFDEVKLASEFEQIAQKMASKGQDAFMYRDCQGRNIMIKEGSPYFIDFQGGMQGTALYDVVSLFWQAKAKIPLEWKEELLSYYLDEYVAELGGDKDLLEKDYQDIVLLRLLQVMGAYGRRGLVEKKAHFISSIPMGLDNLRIWCKTNSLQDYPELGKAIDYITDDKFLETL